MKRILTLSIAAAMLCGANSIAEAAEYKIGGFLQMTGVYENHLGLVEGYSAPTATEKSEFSVRHRMNVNFDIINSESLQSHVGLLVPSVGEWGTNELAAGGGTLGVTLLRAYIDWILPQTDIKVRMGMQQALKAGYFGLGSSPVFGHFAPGIRVDAPINKNLTFQAQWLRLFDTDRTPLSAATANHTSINADYFTVNLPIKFKGGLVTPWASYLKKAEGIDATQGPRMNGVGDNTYWLGFTTKFTMFDPFTFNFDFMYSEANSKNPTPTSFNTTNYDGYGWLADAAVSYKSKFGSTKFGGWYSPGADKDGKNGHFGEIIPAWLSGTAFFHQDIFVAPSLLPSSNANSPNGTLGLLLQHTGFELMKDWSIGGHVMYIKGTHNAASVNAGQTFDPSHLTNKDSLVEFSLWTHYNIMKDLVVSGQFNYILQDFDEDVWFTPQQQNDGMGFSDGFRANLSFRYFF